MKILTLNRCALNIFAAAVTFAGCGGSQRPIGALGAMPQSAATHAARGGSWMLPEAKKSILIYAGGLLRARAGAARRYRGHASRGARRLIGLRGPFAASPARRWTLPGSPGRTRPDELRWHQRAGARPPAHAATRHGRTPSRRELS